MKYYGGCDSGSTYTKCVILDQTGKMVSDVTLRSRINAVLSCEAAIERVLKLKVIDLPVDPQLIGALGAAEFARQKGMAQG